MIKTHASFVPNQLGDRIKSKKSELVLLSILFLGLFLRIYHLGHESIWLDEAFSIKLASSSLYGIIKGSGGDVHPPLYYILLHYWISLFGDSEFSTRFMSAIFGFFAIFMIYKLGNLIFDKNVGILSAMLLALSIFHINYSQEVRMYSLMTLLTLLSFYFFTKFLKNGSFSNLSGYILSSVPLLYTHYYGLFIIIAQNIYIFTLLWLSKESYKFNLKKWIALQLILIVSFSPWLVILIKQTLAVQKNFWIPAPSIKKLIGPFLTYSGSLPLFLFFVGLCILSVINYEKIKNNISWKNFFNVIKIFRLDFSSTADNKVYLMLLWLFTPIILPFTISLIFTPIYITRYTIGASLAFYILVSKGIKDLNHRIIKPVIIIVIVFLSSFNIEGYYNSVNKEQWREIATYLDSKAEIGDLILFNAGYNQGPFDYYSRRTDLRKKPLSEDANYNKEEAKKELSNVLKGDNNVWLIEGSGSSDNGLIREMITESYKLVDFKEYLSESYATGKSICIKVSRFEKNNNKERM